jgi:UDP-2,3-diacylglucosamine hydrolase
MQIPPGKKIFLLSDFHLGVPDAERSLVREKLVVQFLDEIKHEAHTIFIVGDMFDSGKLFQRDMCDCWEKLPN